MQHEVSHSNGRCCGHERFCTQKNPSARSVVIRRAQVSPSTASQGASSPWPAPTTIRRERVTCYEGIKGEDFRHPLDQQNTSMLRSIPGLEMVAKGFLGPAAEQVLLLENIATSIKIGPDQLPSVHKLLIEAAHVLEMEPPELYVRQNPVPNAYTLAIAGRQPFIVIHTALLELLTPRELQAVLSHELGHLKCDHGLWLTVANVLASGTVTVLPIISDMVEEALMRWLRAAELTCDRAALLVAQDPKIVVAALMKLAGGSPSFANELNVDAFLEQARSYDEATNSLIGWYLRNAQTRALSHPLPVMRAREIDRWAQSPEYKALRTKNRANRVQVVEFMGPAQSAMYGLTQGGAGGDAGTPAAPGMIKGGPVGNAASPGPPSGATASPQGGGTASKPSGISNVSSSKWGSQQGTASSGNGARQAQAASGTQQASSNNFLMWPRVFKRR